MALTGRAPLRLVHASDLHLHHSVRREAAATLSGLAAITRRVGADALLIAGDLFDSSNQPTDFVDEVAEGLGGLSCPLVAIPGNHDIRYSPRDGDAFAQLAARLGDQHRWLTAHEGETATLGDGALRIWGRGMPEHTPQNDPLWGLAGGDGDAWHVALAHGEVSTGVHHRSSPIILAQYEATLARVDYLALGHRHDPEIVRAAGGAVVAYSGSASLLFGRGDVAIVDLTEVGIHVRHTRLADEPDAAMHASVRA